MAHKATEQEERAMQGEVTLQTEIDVAEFPMVEARVTYLGRHKHRTIRLKGQVTEERVADPDHPNDRGKDLRGIKKQENEGYTTYNFETHDSIGRPVRTSVINKQRFEKVWHLAHIKWFLEKRDAEGEREFRVSGSPEAMAVVKRYVEATKRKVNPDVGEAVLKEMEDKF